ncbi:hypothetical protein NKH18_45255 [Streptomyces sp. M10(2022)]
MFAFAIPTTWLSVADVERQFKESSTAKRVRKHVLGSLGGVKPGPQAVEAHTHVIAWVREDIARQLGLITDGNFPWARRGMGQVKAAATAWAEEDGKYWVLRRDLPDLEEALDQAHMEHFLAKRQARDAGRAVGREFAAARQDFAATVRASAVRVAAVRTAATDTADAALNDPPASFSPALREPLQSALTLADGARQQLQDALLGDHPSDSEGIANLVDIRRQELAEADSGVAAVRERERALRIAEGERDLRIAEAEQALLIAEAEQGRDDRLTAAGETLTGARDAAQAAFDARRSAQGALDTRIEEVAAQERKAEAAADNLHDLRTQTDRLTRWHQLPNEGTAPTGGRLPKPVVNSSEGTVPQETAVPEETVQQETAARYTDVTDQEDGSPALKSPGGSAYRLLDGPRDGNSFFHALLSLLPRHRSPLAPPRSTKPPPCARGSPTRSPSYRRTRRSWRTCPRTSRTPSPKPRWTPPRSISAPTPRSARSSNHSV